MVQPHYGIWESDDTAWNFIASELNLTIIGDFEQPSNVIVVPEDVQTVDAEVVEEGSSSAE